MRGKEKKSARGGVGSARVEVAAARSEVENAAVWGKIANMPGYFRRKVPVSAGFFGGLTE